MKKAVKTPWKCLEKITSLSFGEFYIGLEKALYPTFAGDQKWSAKICQANFLLAWNLKYYIFLQRLEMSVGMVIS